MKEIKKSPLVIFVQTLIIDTTLFASSSLIIFLANYFFFHKESSFYINIRSLLFALIFQIIIFFYTFINWYFQSFRITKSSINHTKGLIFKKSSSYPIGNLELIEYKQGPLGSLFNYGDIILNKNLNGEGIKIRFFPAPRHYVKYIRSLQNNLKKINNPDLSNNKVNIDTLISDLENEQVEFKASLRWDYKLNKVNKSLEKSVIKTIAGFMNSKGGDLIIGVNDDRSILGLEKDYKSLPKKGRDGFENHFNQIFAKMIGSELHQFVSVQFIKKNNKDICHIHINPSYIPVYVKESDKKENFYVRTGNTTTSMSLREANSYINHHWK